MIDSAARNLVWSKSDQALKVLFVAGNESFSQGPTPFQEAISNAREKGIIVNTIHCGDYQGGVRSHWKTGAVLGKGEYFSIDHNNKVAYVEAPQDRKITKLNALLNETYIPYGRHGSRGMQRQRAEDSNANFHRKSAVTRSLSKSSSYYSNAAWDLVDAIDKEGLSLKKVDAAALPKNMQKMTCNSHERNTSQK